MTNKESGIQLPRRRFLQLPAIGVSKGLDPIARVGEFVSQDPEKLVALVDKTVRIGTQVLESVRDKGLDEPSTKDEDIDLSQEAADAVSALLRKHTEVLKGAGFTDPSLLVNPIATRLSAASTTAIFRKAVVAAYSDKPYICIYQLIDDPPPYIVNSWRGGINPQPGTVERGYIDDFSMLDVTRRGSDRNGAVFTQPLFEMVWKGQDGKQMSGEQFVDDHNEFHGTNLIYLGDLEPIK